MAGLGSVGADEGALLIAVDHLIVGDLAVEEDDGDTGGLSGLNSVLSGIGRGSLNDVDDQQVSAVGDGGVDLVGLLGLVASTVIVGVVHAHSLELLIHRAADAGDVHVRVVIVEHAHVQRGGLRVLSARGRGLLRGLAAAAGQQAQHHDSRQENCKCLFHLSSSSRSLIIRSRRSGRLAVMMLLYRLPFEKAIEKTSLI